MPEVLKELTDSQKKLLELLFLPENKEVVLSGSWTPIMVQAGYTPSASKSAVMGSKLFREEFEKRVANYLATLQLQAVHVVEDVMTGVGLSPMAQLQLAAAKDTMDRSGKLIKRTEQKVTQDLAGSVILMPAKDEIDPDE